MTQGILTLLTFISAVLFPWPLTAALAFVSSFTEPLVPLAIGIFADTLYYAPHAYTLPLFTICGTILTFSMLFVRSRLRSSPVRDL